jgi:hypothetical protein
MLRSGLGTTASTAVGLEEPNAAREALSAQLPDDGMC